MVFDLKTDDGLRRACESVDFDSEAWLKDWLKKTKTFVEKVANVPREFFFSEEYQERLWEDNPICDAGGLAPRVEVSRVIQDENFLVWFYDKYQEIRSLESQDRTESLHEFKDHLLECVVSYSSDMRKPRYVMYRALAALFPENFTNVASEKQLKLLAKYMGVEGNPVVVHRSILDRLDGVRDPVESGDWDKVSRRLLLPWILLHPEETDEERELTAGEKQRPDGPTTSVEVHVPQLEDISSQVESKGYFPDNICRKLHLGLWADSRRHFAVLTGISGSGKTLLARAYAEAITGEDPTEENLKKSCIVAVQPGWTDPSYLLGYANPIQKNTFECTPFLKLLLHAADNPHTPHVAVLDEMNLSHPEQYMAPLLSAMETGGSIEIHGRGETFDDVPQSVLYPNNLVLIGTVNMDETTHGLADKILDRAFTLEFWEVDVDKWPDWGNSNLPAEEADSVKKILGELMKALEDARLHFGYRVIEEIVAFLTRRLKDCPEWPLTDALDEAVYAKVLPKLRGDDSTRVHKALSDCKGVLQTHGLSRSEKKVQELSDDLEATGSARFLR